MPTCITCGMPLEGAHAGDVGMTIAEGPICKYDIENGVIKAPEAIFEGGASYFTTACAGGDRDLATRLTRRNMRALPYWQARPFAQLDGPEATDAEWGTAMSTL